MEETEFVDQAPVVLETRELTKSFGGLRAIDRCSIQVRQGTITGLIGPNGAGKSTLFNLITGFYKPDSGQVLFNGAPIQGLPPHQVFRRGIFRTFQIARELKRMTVLENLMLVPDGQKGESLLKLWSAPGSVRQQEHAIRERAEEVLKTVELYDLKDEYAGNLSVGQKKLLELARAMMARPKLVLLDEPAAGVNPSLMRRLAAQIEAMVFQHGMTVFLVEHDMDLVMGICDPIIVMTSGTKLTEGHPSEIRQDPRVLEAYLGSPVR